jgi:hypothetical protein
MFRERGSTVRSFSAGERALSFSGGEEEGEGEEGVGRLRSSAPRMPSRLRKRRVDPRRSNWMAAVPNTSGEAKVRRAWFREKVISRERSWRRIKDRVVESVVVRRDGWLDVNRLRWNGLAVSCAPEGIGTKRGRGKGRRDGRDDGSRSASFKKPRLNF